MRRGALAVAALGPGPPAITTSPSLSLSAGIGIPACRAIGDTYGAGVEVVEPAAYAVVVATM